MSKSPKAGSSPSLLSAGQSCHEAARALFDECFDRLRRLTGAWLLTPDDESLHDLRIGLRRFRVLLRVFREETESHGGRTLREAMSRLGDRLGMVRDFDVMMELVAGTDLVADAGPEAEAGRVIEEMRRKQAVCFDAAWKHMNGAGWRHASDLARRFLERLAADRTFAPGLTIREFLDREFRRNRKRIAKAFAMAEAREADTLHAFRIMLRRMRYLGDLLEPVAGKAQRKVFKRVHACEQRLGKVHDVDMALAFLAAHPGLAPPALEEELAGVREDRLQEFLAKWEKCRRLLET